MACSYGPADPPFLSDTTTIEAAPRFSQAGDFDCRLLVGLDPPLSVLRQCRSCRDLSTSGLVRYRGPIPALKITIGFLLWGVVILWLASRFQDLCTLSLCYGRIGLSSFAPQIVGQLRAREPETSGDCGCPGDGDQREA